MHLDSLALLDLVIGRMSLFLFLVPKEASASLPTVHFVTLRALLPIQQAQCDQAFLLKPASFGSSPLVSAEACIIRKVLRWFLQKPASFGKFSVGFGSNNKTATYFPFTSAETVTLSLLHFPYLHYCFYLTLSSVSVRNCPLSRSGCNGPPIIYFFRVMARPISLPDKMVFCFFSFLAATNDDCADLVLLNAVRLQQPSFILERYCCAECWT